MINARSSLWSALAATLLAAATAAQSTWYVDVNGTPPGSGTQIDPYTSIQFAISQPTTAPGDTILVHSGIYLETVDFQGKALDLQSIQGASLTTINALLSGTTVTLAANSLLDGFTIRGGSGTAGVMTSSFGGGIAVIGETGPMTVRNCVVRSNRAVTGGGLGVYQGGPLTIEDCDFYQNTALDDPSASIDGDGGGGAIIGAIGPVDLVRCTIGSNRCAGDGAGLAVIDCDVRLEDCTLKGNRAEWTGWGSIASRGGGLYAEEITTGTRIDLKGCTVAENLVVGNMTSGGGLAYYTASGTIEGCTIVGNVAGDDQWAYVGIGGGLSVVGAQVQFGTLVTVTDTLIEDNLAEWAGGGVYCEPGWFGSGSAMLKGCTIDANYSWRGAGVYTTGAELQLGECGIRGNVGYSTASQDFGGGVHGPAVLTGCEIADHLIAGEGAGVYRATLIDCDVHGNRVGPGSTGLAARGAGAMDSTLTDCRLWNNEVIGGTTSPAEVAQGGGAYGCTLVGCALYHNFATTGLAPGEGGGAHSSKLERCTVYENAADQGAGVHSTSLEHCTVFNNQGVGMQDGASAHNSILRGNQGSQIAGGPAVTWCNVEGGWTGTGNIDAPELWWSPYGAGGLGHDFHFADPSSPGIDAGDPASPPDPGGSIADLGPYWWDAGWRPTPVVYCAPKAASAGCLAEINWTGEPGLTGSDDFHVVAREVVNQQNGVFFWGLGWTGVPFQGGTLCVQPPLARTPVQASGGGAGGPDCSGSLDFHFSQGYMAARGLSATDGIYGQYWFSDPLDPVSGTGLSDALHFLIWP